MIHINKIFKRTADVDRWVLLNEEEQNAVTLGMIKSGVVRFMIDIHVGGERAFLVTDNIDKEALKNKYPESMVLNLHQWWRLMFQEDSALQYTTSIKPYTEAFTDSELMQLKAVM